MTENRRKWPSVNNLSRIYVSNLFDLWILQLHCRGPVMLTFDNSTVCFWWKLKKTQQMRLDNVKQKTRGNSGSWNRLSHGLRLWLRQWFVFFLKNLTVVWKLSLRGWQWLNTNFCIFFIFQDIVYIIGGNCGRSADFIITYEVITVSLNTGVISEAEDILHAFCFAGSASSFNRIVICGGMHQSGAKGLCQLFSPDSNRYVCLKLCVCFHPLKLGQSVTHLLQQIILRFISSAFCLIIII